MGCWRDKMLAFWILSNWKLFFIQSADHSVFLFSWWLRCESRFFHARGLRDCVLRVRTPPALCEQLTNIVQRGWNHQTSGGFRTLTHVQCIYIIIQAKMWEVDLQNSGVLCISSSPFHVLALKLNDPSPRRLVSIGLRCITWTPSPVASTTLWHCGFKKRRRTKPLPAPWKRNRRWDEARLAFDWLVLVSCYNGLYYNIHLYIYI